MEANPPIYVSKDTMQGHFAKLYQAGLYIIFMKQDPAARIPIHKAFDFHFENARKQKLYVKWIRQSPNKASDLNLPLISAQF